VAILRKSLSPQKAFLDAMTLFICLLVEAEGLFAIAFVWNDSRRATLTEPIAQFGTDVGFVAEHFPGRLRSPNQSPGWWTIMCFAASQHDGKKTAFSIRDCMDFRVAPAARASNRLRLLPLFAPDAERWALTYVESIIWTSPDRPRPAR